MHTRTKTRTYTTATILLSLVCYGIAHGAEANTDLEQAWRSPPVNARLRAYWWWLNGNVTKESIKHDLEEMAAKGFGGVLICDAGGAEQDGNDRVPHGPTFLSHTWRELYKYTLQQADRLSLELSLNIQSGWNLGGPMIKAEEAPKKLVWSEVLVKGPTKFEQTLPKPKHKPELYRDTLVVAFPVKHTSNGDADAITISASTTQKGHPATNATDGNENSFWVSGGSKEGEGPTRKRPEWLQMSCDQPIAVNAVSVTGRNGYGPRECELQASDDGVTFRKLKAFTIADAKEHVAKFDEVQAKHFRLVIFSSFDPRHPQAPRNVQITELKLLGKDKVWPGAAKRHRPIQLLECKALLKRYAHFSAPDCTPLMQDISPESGEEDLLSKDVIDLTSHFDKDGVLRWEAPAGTWQILRFGYTLNDHCKVSTCSDGWQGYALDPLDGDVFRAYWKQVVDPLIDDAGPLAGRVLKYLHTDSWEVENMNWTPTLRGEFQKRRGYDLLGYLPVIAGRIVNDRHMSNQFLHDFRKTVGDLAMDNHLRLFAEMAHARGLQIHPESGGPHCVPIDAQRCLGNNDAPMSEFWARSWRHRVTDENRFFVKQPASAAHTYGRPLVLAEGFTTIGPHWQETLWDNLKPTFDQAACEGLNLLFWHAIVSSPVEMGIPGQQYFAGTHLNPNTTWWPKSASFFAYLNRCQSLLQRGLFVADVLCYYGDHVPNFSQRKQSDPAHILPGYDYDVAPEEILLTRLSEKDGRLVLPDGKSYRALVLPDLKGISLPVLRKLNKLVEAGATIIGPKPEYATGLTDYPRSNEEIAKLAQNLWGDCDGKSVTEHRVGRGRVISGKTAREVLQADSVKPDMEFAGDKTDTFLDYIHRRDNDAEIYFVANRAGRDENARCTFRVAGKAPELWDPVTGQTRLLPEFSESDGRTTIPLQFTPYGSMFIVFRKPVSSEAAAKGGSNFPAYAPACELSGAWTVNFDPKWGGPESAEFEQLVSWTTRPESGIKFYSGTATYRKTFDVPEAVKMDGGRLVLDLGNVRQLAEVRLNGKNLGVLWTMPFRVDVTEALKQKDNTLEIEVVNFWPNRIIGDDSLPAEQRLTRTNIRKLTKDTPLEESGLLGPVRIMGQEERDRFDY